MGNYNVIGNNSNDKHSLLNILKNFIFDNATLEIHSETKVYNTNDIAYIINEEGLIQIIIAKIDNISGRYIPEQWSTMTLSDKIHKDTKDIAVISKTKPINPNVRIWAEPITTSFHDIPTAGEIENDENIVDVLQLTLDTNGDIPVVDDIYSIDLSALEAGDIVIDTENEPTNMNIDVNIKNNSTIDSQDDILVSDNPPKADDSEFVWVDTDVSDD